jgi:flagellar hook assembly protein FlgD
LPKGTSTVTLTLEGDLNTGGKFRGTVTVDVVSSGGTMAASVSPNPLNPTAVLTFSTTRAGQVRVSVFDLRGRRVRVLEPGAYLEPGYHDIMFDGRSDRGEPLPSGAYFYRIEAAEGSETGRFVIVK